MLARLARDRDAAQHSCQFLHPLVIAERTNRRAAGAAVGELRDPVLVVRQARDLREVRDTQHLPARAELAQLATDDFGNAAGTNLLVEEVLRTAVEKTVYDVVEKYDSAALIKRVVVTDNSGRQLLESPTVDILERVRAGPRKVTPNLIQ